MAMAMADSVTVSMGEEMRGVFRVIFLVRADVRSWRGREATMNTRGGKLLAPHDLIQRSTIRF